ncbi:phosphate ABC transporter substrate-binding protein PstS [Gulosibacter molinativorax]|uniref:Phosphate-binding protein n=1 Tax=Gulosibacter molinativorax TaxID=256821 RepID=A0ABT7C401_9MICO|nr:phosphate ABC transporter substrate-binding protein PstS [Gulosibacter molinativorax]MDJ1369967.1 phosphate ABC transporter substrate-binding protein PstS [Gulosibacter molinativorax]QUY63843.1 Phosphate-binding protein PstS [Gulosibacter molinativorax]
MKLSRVGTSVAMTAIAALALAGCAGGGDTASTTDPASGATDGAAASGSLSGELNATGASSQELAQLNGWVPGFKAVEADVTVNYTATGSGTGRDNFVAGTSDFIGSDRAFKLDEIESETFPLCAEGTDLVEFPAYISPIAVAYNLPSVDALNLDATVISQIFAGEITTWNDPAIAELNPDTELPDTAINAVHRGDASGTTGNFLSYLESAAPEAWTFGTEDEFPADLGGEAAQQTAGVAAAISAGEGSIGYLDASQAADLQVAAIKSGEGFVEYTPEAAAAVVAGSPLEEGRAETDVVYDLDYTGVEGGYPIVLVSYLVGCHDYQDDAKAELVKAYFSYVVSAEGQDAAVAAAQNAPLSDELRTQVQTAIDAIQ